MELEELTPEIVALMRKLINNPSPVADSPLLRLLLADRLVMGSPAKVHLTSQGHRMLAAYAAKEP
ncbi:hypothetical protein [Devosia sp. SL43]|uniref:hypothetical protein n=1 Tax=Devosia sp. SL43 TaxID=2806348 RepID=UPI001F2EEE8D|nr:hypothetical protein [Devosia sp. SL43]UJW86490.1 hypothetical protein IM737_04275 [Devosia sp. SL43]